jgi:hypothetical protein
MRSLLRAGQPRKKDAVISKNNYCIKTWLPNCSEVPQNWRASTAVGFPGLKASDMDLGGAPGFMQEV